MTVKEILELKQAGMTTEEIAQLAQHITTEQPAAPTVSVEEKPTVASEILSMMSERLGQMQEQIKQMQQTNGEQIVKALKEVQEKIYYGNVNTATGAEAATETDTQAAANNYIANIINPANNEPVGGVRNAESNS